MSKRNEVISLYRQILRVAKNWKASSNLAKDTLEERKYIMKECRQQFRENSKLKNPMEIERCLEEAKTRLELALHYGNPYPRPCSRKQ
ncbi:LYR motif containing protein 1-like isoform X3 [Xenia sp. Carnegie-2017]|uniref:LYR motif containing protein 1-like isoform X3 n=1 Tax=Xenia sp. Carnegie-2017 TaxID=2897299 RepID=UPI001F0498D2|nr:LYR motif containing protein 1-like isoform X3 [Xenia sp. Carnegie-2017]